MNITVFDGYHSPERQRGSDLNAYPLINEYDSANMGSASGMSDDGNRVIVSLSNYYPRDLRSRVYEWSGSD